MTTWNWESSWPAPAKLNLFLHVVGRRSDGYHLLQTVFRFIDRGDSLRFSPRSDGEIRLLTPLPGVSAEDNLIVRAAQLLKHETRCLDGVDITLEKRLPMGGGLGGGSSDAATVLLALNQLWRQYLPRWHLAKMSLYLGADVPVFVSGRNAFAQGVGEALKPVDLPPAWYLVVEPPVEVPTAVIFGAPELCRETPRMQPEDWRPGMGHNDLQPVACARFPEVAEHLAALGALAPAMMTGSGACVFASFATREDAERAAAALPNGMRHWIAAGLSAHPLANL